MKVLAIVGSLRKGSFNKMAAIAAQELAPTDVQVEYAQIGDLPLYNQDVEDSGPPSEVTRLKDHVRSCDAILFVTPEYNYSMPGVLKNAIDWVSRPPSENPFSGKPCGIISASTGMLGGARAQYHLRQSAVFVNLLVMNKPEIVIAKAADKFDSSGKLTDEPTRKMLAAFMRSLKEWTERLGH